METKKTFDIVLERAKKENWTEGWTKLIVAIMKGEVIIEKEYKIEGNVFYNGKGTGQKTQRSVSGWFLAGYRLTEENISKLKKFAFENDIPLKMMSIEEIKADEINKRKKQVLENLQIQITVSRWNSRNSRTVVFDYKGMFDEAIGKAKISIDPQEKGRRGLVANIYQIFLKSNKKHPLTAYACERGSAIITFLEKLKKDDMNIMLILNK